MRKALIALSVFWATLIIVGVAFAGEDKKTDVFLGVYVDEVTSEIASDYGVKAGEGVLVSGTVDGSAADEIGLRANDILLKLDGATLTGPAELRHQIAKHKAGDKVSVTYLRGGKSKTTEVALTERKNKGVFFSTGDDEDTFVWSDKDKKLKFWSEDDNDEIAFAGIVTQELGEGLQQYFKVENGALISEVVKDSPAEKAGLKAGDVVIKIGTRDIDDTGDVSKAIRKHDPGDEVEFIVMRDGAKKTIKLTLTSRGEYYGNADNDEIRLGLNLDCPNIDGLMITPDGDVKRFTHEFNIQMDELNETLQELNIEIDELPDVNMELSIDPVPPIIEMNFDQARAISSDAWWKRSWNDMKSKLEVEFDSLKAEFQRLKGELKQLQEELKQRML
ncbi:PDZ domain-containing protein [bacterium]|nr:PDZ domain-containing protein [bacterium]